MDILTAYQRSSRLEISLQALMPTPVQLSTVGQPFIQGNLKLHVIEGAILAGGPTVAFVFNDDNDHFYMHMCIYKEIHTCHLRPLYIFSFLCHNWTTDGALSSLLLTSLVSNSSKGHLLWTSSINWVREFNIAAESALHTSAHMYSIRWIPFLTQRS